MTLDRLADGYEPDFDLDSVVGRQGEFFVKDIADGIASGRVEVKTDEMARRTGNVYIETQCLYRGEYRDSGIRTTKAEVWAFVVGERRMMIALPVHIVRQMAERAGSERACRDGSHPTKGVTVPLFRLVSWAMTLLEASA